ncbi:unnamed protein product [Ceutorhynchus assimilis]|uniref:Uncharacterized protein n=1 Tax=Ceutorhynchus assimilis TaxID=467358 RepID=A0A9N9MNT3_9CUCU|nr:unnamed protein product [Ceutorhynchus assimilis]
MSKRYNNNYHELNNSKKPKLDEDEEWEGEEIDEEALNKCFDNATQAVQEQSLNQSILPSYHAFIKPTSFASSTQAVNNTQIKEKELELVIAKLKQLNAEKDGEISILRSKIKDNTVTHQVEQQKTTSEWREKYQSASKEVKTVRSDLDFKNLEIANLKQQLANQRRINLDATVNSQLVLAPKPLPKHLERNLNTKDRPQSNNSIKEPILDLITPLKCLSTINFADNDVESHLIKNTKKFYKLSRITIPYLQNQETCNEINFHHKCPQIDKKPITIEDVYSDILTLANSRVDKLNIESIDKIIAVGLILLKDLNDYLMEYGSNLKTEDIQQADTDYLEGIESDDFKLGIQAGKLLKIIAQLILCNEHTADFICYDKLLKLPPHLREYALLIPHRNGAVQNDYYCLRLVLTIVENIGKYRLTRQTNDFLIAVTILLKNIALMLKGYSTTSKPINDALFCKLFKELVFTRPGDKMIEQITFLLKNCSQYKAFIDYLFKSDPSKEPLMVRSKAKTVLLFNKNACCMCVLACQLKNYIIKIENLPLDVCYNMLSFMYNIVKKSHWIHYENTDNVCSCLLQLYRLQIQFLYKGLTNFKERKNTETLDEWKTFFEDQLIQKVLNQINFISYELILKKPSVLAQYKEIERYLINQGKFDLVQLNISETVSPETIRNEDF